MGTLTSQLQFYKVQCVGLFQIIIFSWARCCFFFSFWMKTMENVGLMMTLESLQFGGSDIEK